MGAVEKGRICIFGAGGPVGAAIAPLLCEHYTVRFTDVATAGEVVAEVVNPLTEDDGARRCAIKAQADGILFARSADRFARPGRILAKIAGREPLKSTGQNLLTL